MTNLTDQLKAALALDAARVRDQAKHEDSDGYFGFITGAEWERARTAAIDQALCEVVEFLERNAPRFYGETEVALEALFDRLRAALEGRG